MKLKAKYKVGDVILQIKRDAVDFAGTIYKIQSVVPGEGYNIKYLNTARSRSTNNYYWAIQYCDPNTTKISKLGRLFYL